MIQVTRAVKVVGVMQVSDQSDPINASKGFKFFGLVDGWDWWVDLWSYLWRCQVAEARVGALDRILLDDAEARARFAVAQVARAHAVLSVVEAVGPVQSQIQSIIHFFMTCYYTTLAKFMKKMFTSYWNRVKNGKLKSVYLLNGWSYNFFL